MNTFLKVGVAAAVIAFAAGCTDIKPLQADIDALKQSVARAQSSADAAGAAAEGANRAASSRAGEPAVLRRDEREDRPYVQEVDVQVIDSEPADRDLRIEGLPVQTGRPFLFRRTLPLHR
jgi:hypothetical protein